METSKMKKQNDKNPECKCLKSKIPKYLKVDPTQCLGVSTFRCLGI
jgi:hypothetical protein